MKGLGFDHFHAHAFPHCLERRVMMSGPVRWLTARHLLGYATDMVHPGVTQGMMMMHGLGAAVNCRW